MRETETDVTTTPQQSAEPEVVIDGITFEEGKLWKALYPSLIHYNLPVPPGYQVEPAIQITDPARSELTVRLALASGFIFQAEPADAAMAKARWIEGTDNAPPSCISTVLESPGACLVTWTRDSSSPSAIALRFFCRPEIGPEPTDPESVVEGGVYLAFVVREETWPGEIIRYLEEHPPDPSAPWGALPSPQEDLDTMKVHVLLLPAGHVKYNLFVPDAPAGTEFEPAFRVRRHSTTPLDVDFEIVNPGFVYQPKPGNPEEVDREITHPAASIEPLDLETRFGSQQKICRVSWTSAVSDQLSGLSCSFNMIAQLAEGQLPSFRPVDPTVIEPPRCTGGICAD